MLNLIVWNGTVFDIETVLRLNWIVWNKTDFCIKIDLGLNNLQRLICHKTQTTNQNIIYILCIYKSWYI